MAEVWYLEVQDLRRAYQTLGTRPNEWQVSQRGGTRNPTFEPEIGWLILIYERCHERNSIDDGRTQTAQWRREFRAY